MRVAAALGAAGGAGRVGQEAQVLRAAFMRRGRGVDRQRAIPRNRPGNRRGRRRGHSPGHRPRHGATHATRCLGVVARRGDPVGWHHPVIVIPRAQVVGIGVDDDAVQAPVLHKACQPGRQFLRGKGHLRATVLQVMRQLVFRAHRVHRHHHRVGAQHRVVGNDELRTVLAQQQHPVARLDARAVLQIAGHGVDLALQARVVQHHVVEHDGGLVGIARGRGLQVEIQAGPRLADVRRQPLGPIPQMRLLHPCLRVPAQGAVRARRSCPAR
ncbi:hypothetical protein D3C72_939200 [compost metagenome]